VEVIVSNVPGRIDHVPDYFVLGSLYTVCITLFGAIPQLDTVCMSKRILGFVCIKEVCYEGTVRNSFLSANTLACILGPVPLVSF
jgi:hypothetical protein